MLGKLISVVMAAVLLVGGLMVAGCPAPAVEDAPKVELVFDIPSEWDKVVEAAKLEGHVTVVGFGSTTEHDFYRRLGRIFTERYGISFTYRDVGWFAAVEKITDEVRRNATGDIDAVMIWSVPFSEGHKGGIWWDVPIIDFVPNAKVVPYVNRYFSDFFPTWGRHVPVFNYAVAMVYNRQWVREGKMEAPPRTFDELLPWVKRNPGMFAYCDPNKGGSGHTFLNAVMYHINGYETYKFAPFDEERAAELNKPVFDYLLELAPYLYQADPYPAGNMAAFDLLAAGEVGLQPQWMSITMQAIAAGRISPDMVGTYMMDPPFPQPMDGYAIPVNAPNKNAALVWINFMLSEEVQKKLPAEVGFFPVNADAMPDVVTYKGIKGSGVWLPDNISTREELKAWRDPLREPDFRYRHGLYMFHAMKAWTEAVKARTR
jgi:putative spermidine/putrescine transport system substrate-binding protein